VEQTQHSTKMHEERVVGERKEGVTRWRSVEGALEAEVQPKKRREQGAGRTDWKGRSRLAQYASTRETTDVVGRSL
jgi:hypothetical protein